MSAKLIARIDHLKKRLQEAESQRQRDKAEIYRLTAELDLARREEREFEVSRRVIEAVDAGLRDLRAA